LQQLMIVLGLFFAFLSNYAIANSAGSAAAIWWTGFAAWQWMFWVEMIPASLFFLCLLLVPESPRYLVAAGQDARAADVLRSLAPQDDIAARVADIQSTLIRQRKPLLRDLISQHSGKLQPIVWAGIMLAVLQQFTGINVVFYYGATLWQAAGFSENDALAVNVISGAVNISFTLVAIALVDKLGRKQLLLIGALGQALMLGILALIFASAAVSDKGRLILDGNTGIYALLAANGYIAFFATTWGPVVWVMLGEMFPNQLRGAALAVCGILHWLSNFTITMSFPVLLASFGLGIAYGLYALFGLLAFVLVKNMLQETRGRTLEQISRDAMQ
jgi:MFS transporter, SP family, sugar:H+ symporter